VSADRIVLSGRIRSELADLERVVGRGLREFDKAQQSGDDEWLDAVALNLHNYYAGAEGIFEEIAREVDGAIPAGPEWHRSLLWQMAAELPGLRPPVIGRATRDCLDEYRSFRHVVRNVYTFNLRPARVRELILGLRSCYDVLTEDMIAFCSFLEISDAD
jgi:hypothetical protein